MNNSELRELPLPKVGRQVAFLETDDKYVRKGEGAFLRLKDGTIIHAYTEYCGGDVGDHGTAHIAYVRSVDEGETWTYEGILLAKGDNDINIMSVSFLRLPGDEILLFYLKKTAQNGSVSCLPYVRSSFDECKTWGEERCCVTPAEGYYILNNDRVIRLQSGRILFAVGKHPQKPFKEYGETTHFFASDDNGKTWKKLPAENRMPFPNVHGFEEPGLYQHEDGRIWGYTRTDIGCQFLFDSLDDGNTWSVPTPSTFFTGARSPMLVKKVCGKYTVAVFNPISLYTGRNLGSIRGRAPFLLAVSKDDGVTHAGTSFPNLFYLEDDLDNDYCYPAILDCENYFLVAYYHSNGRTRPLNCLKILKVEKEELKGEAPYDYVVMDVDSVSCGDTTPAAKLREMGIEFVPASAKAYSQMPLLDDPNIRYHIASNGALIYDKETGPVWQMPMSGELKDFVLDTLRGAELTVHAGGDVVQEIPPEIHMVRAEFADETQLQKCLQILQNHAELTALRAAGNCLEVFHRRAGKGNALRGLAQVLGVRYKRSVAVSADDDQHALLRFAGLGLATIDAPDQLQQTADITLSYRGEDTLDYIFTRYFE